MADAIPETMTLTLRKPVWIGAKQPADDAEVYSALVLREPTVGEWLEFEKLPQVPGFAMALALVSGIPLPAIQKIGAGDIRKGMGYLGRFLYDELPADDYGAGDEWEMPLLRPFTFADVTYATLKLHEPNAIEWEKFDGVPGRTADLRAIATVSGVAEAALGKMSARDLRRGASFVASFLFDAPATGRGD